MKTPFSLSIGFLGVLLLTNVLHAQHLRIFACAIGNDSTGAFLGGSSNGSGLYQSDDTGKTWRHLGWNNIKCFSMDMVQSSNGRIIYEATGLGVLRSTDYGEHWKQLTDWRISEVMDVAVNQKNPEEIYIATAHGPWWTEDAGKTWNTSIRGMYEPYASMAAYAIPNYDTVFLCSRNTSYIRTANDAAWIGSPEPAPRTIDPYECHLDGMARSSSRLVIGDEETGLVLIATLGSGVMRQSKRVMPPENKLPYRQIWTLKSFLVTP
ncbi:MAG: hypothetical protein Q8922_10775 [Bacteroidota bacterium]|nr:hypothetical protein [Bacteroidota bacterium]MDP4232669.1 hypothetical protein [Bacteroidota bacterium]MDP4243198.1 hypothetical protein [Bacteroidota bacterium]MDP4288410.1 hypothetical protein [Bacteroidota bacterium]